MSFNSPLHWEETLKDGTHIFLRPITLTDFVLEKDFFQGLSNRSKHDRFLGGVTNLSDHQLHEMCNIDFSHDMAFVATLPSRDSEEIIGISRYSEDKQRNKHAEISVVVSDDWQNKGLGTILLTHLVEFAKKVGVKQLYSIDSNSNTKMKKMSEDFHFNRKTDPTDPTQVIYRLSFH